MINSVNGLLHVDELGTTLMHEHILQANWSMRMSFKDWFDYDSFIEWASEDIRRTKETGVQTLVEQTPVCLGRDIHAIKAVADRTGMQIIASTGLPIATHSWYKN
jgi:phosphotriesterase-related protein